MQATPATNNSTESSAAQTQSTPASNNQTESSAVQKQSTQEASPVKAQTENKSDEQQQVEGLSAEEAWILSMPESMLQKEHGPMKYSNLAIKSQNIWIFRCI